tara:strand:+ start:2341 stop:3183 length:843 start_codon:yes stop_codon:yes gene_type:complete
MKYIEILKKAQKDLTRKSILTPALDAELILSNILKIKREKLILNLQKKIDSNHLRLFNLFIEQRKKNIPIAYILKYKHFWKSTFYVNNSVLIPRPATELIVEKVLEKVPKDQSFKFLDIGTGSGCILISILLERPKSTGIGIDISPSAIKVAEFNAKMQQLKNRIKFINSDVDKFFAYKYDIIVSNPPYINKFNFKNLQKDVKDYEPKVALDGGLNGISMIKKVIEKSSILIKKNGNLVLEIDNQILKESKKLLKKYNFYINDISKDLTNNYRCIFSTKY